MMTEETITRSDDEAAAVQHYLGHGDIQGIRPCATSTADGMGLPAGSIALPIQHDLAVLMVRVFSIMNVTRR